LIWKNQKKKELIYIPEEHLTELSSLRLWAPVNQAIVDNDMRTADAEKKRIEADQRIRLSDLKEQGLEDERAEHFEILEDQLWHFKDNISLSIYYDNM